MECGTPAIMLAKRRTEPWYDDECRISNSAVNNAYNVRAYPPTAKDVMREYHSLTRRKRRVCVRDEIAQAIFHRSRTSLLFEGS
jgi:hypothetical protein